MEKTLSLSEGNVLFSKLQCVRCGKCLSVEPVSENNGRYICGRCCPEGTQCPLYATIAEHLTFPCVFELCEVQLKWRDVTTHERFCYFRNMSCPFIGCLDKYQFTEYPSHFNLVHELHREKYCSDDIHLTISSPNHDNLHCIIYDGIIFLVFIKIHPPSPNGVIGALFGVFFISGGEDLSDLACEVKINNSNNNANETINCKDVEEYLDSRHCLGCLREFCDKPEHANTGDAFLTGVLEFTAQRSFSYTIKVYKKTSNSDVSRSYSTECPICYNDFGEQIYLCPTGHSFCSYCRENIDKCPFCKVRLSGNLVRNYALEDLVKERSNIH